ncbi:MAG: TOBE domain-containing protein, partial [Candidatus Neomarinimicrobiota bacterium]
AGDLANQNYALYPHMNVYKNLAFSLKLRKYSSQEIKERVNRTANILEIGQYLEKKPKELSGGERQRVALGRAIVRNPKVFLFDEPLSNLDAKLRVQMRAEIKRLHRELHTTMIYVTHDQVEAMTMGDRIVILKDGVIQQVGSPQDVYQRPANKFVGSFIGSPAMNFIYGTIQNGKFAAPGINIDLNLKGRLADGLEVSLGIRPEDITINRGNVEATVVIIEPLGSETIIHVKIGEASILVKHQSLTTLQTGEKITVQFKAEKIVLFDKATEDPVNI